MSGLFMLGYVRSCYFRVGQNKSG